MTPLEIESTRNTPQVFLDKEAPIFSISGVSMPSNASSFFQPIIDWMKEYAQNPLAETLLIIRLEYYNTASTKYLLALMQLLESVRGASVVWYYPADQAEIALEIEEFEELVKIPVMKQSY